MLRELVSDPSRLAIVAHDAGAANHIISWVAEEPGPYRVFVDGPARQLWQQRFADTGEKGVVEALAGAECLLSGTGWASSLEHDARKLACGHGVVSVAVIDHWVNYRDRFERNDELVLPDRLWVTDPMAVAIANGAFPGLPVDMLPNRYLAEQVSGAGRCPDHGDVLFVAEPARTDWGRGVPGEFQSLDFLRAEGHRAGVPSDRPLRIRAHPSDPPGKYDAWIARQPNATLDRSRDMGEALTNARWVVGLQSYALVIALASGRAAISALPPWASSLILPHEGIVQLRSIVLPQAKSR